MLKVISFSLQEDYTFLKTYYQENYKCIYHECKPHLKKLQLDYKSFKYYLKEFLFHPTDTHSCPTLTFIFQIEFQGLTIRLFNGQHKKIFFPSHVAVSDRIHMLQIMIEHSQPDLVLIQNHNQVYDFDLKYYNKISYRNYTFYVKDHLIIERRGFNIYGAWVQIYGIIIYNHKGMRYFNNQLAQILLFGLLTQEKHNKIIFAGTLYADKKELKILHNKFND